MRSTRLRHSSDIRVKRQIIELAATLLIEVSQLHNGAERCHSGWHRQCPLQAIRHGQVPSGTQVSHTIYSCCILSEMSLDTLLSRPLVSVSMHPDVTRCGPIRSCIFQTTAQLIHICNQMPIMQDCVRSSDQMQSYRHGHSARCGKVLLAESNEGRPHAYRGHCHLSRGSWVSRSCPGLQILFIAIT